MFETPLRNSLKHTDSWVCSSRSSSSASSTVHSMVPHAQVEVICTHSWSPRTGTVCGACYQAGGGLRGSSSAGESIGAEQKKELTFCCSALFIFRSARKKNNAWTWSNIRNECVHDILMARCIHVSGTNTVTNQWKNRNLASMTPEGLLSSQIQQPPGCSRWRRLPFHKGPVKAAGLWRENTKIFIYL